MQKEIPQVKIKNMSNKDVVRAAKNEKFFAQVLKSNKGFVEAAVLQVISGDWQHRDLQDLISIGQFCLWKAANKYDIKRVGKSSFSTFSYRVIQNGVRQELKILNRMRRKDTSIEQYTFQDYSSGNNSSEYNEKYFVDDNNIQLKKLKNFEEFVLNEIVLRDRIKLLSDYEKKVFDIKFVAGKTLKETAKELGVNFHTLRQWYYSKGKPKFDEVLKSEV